MARGLGALQCILSDFAGGVSNALSSVATAIGDARAAGQQRNAACMSDGMCMALSFGGGSMARGGSALALRAEFGAVHAKFWTNEGATNAGAYSAADLVRMRAGQAPIGPDGFPLELHHKNPLNKGGTNDISNLEILSRTDHRLGENYRRNHPPEDED